jgi:hypothetical protein
MVDNNMVSSNGRPQRSQWLHILAHSDTICFVAKVTEGRSHLGVIPKGNCIYLWNIKLWGSNELLADIVCQIKL